MVTADRITVRAVRDLLAAADDSAGHHIFWVGTAGDVHLELLSFDGPSPALWGDENAYRVKFRLETLPGGLGYVGPSAERDRAWVESIHRMIREHWRIGTSGYADEVVLMQAHVSGR